MLVPIASLRASALKTKPKIEEGITEISLERTPCYGDCPADWVILRADETAFYYPKGKSGATRMKGKIDKWDFAPLAKLLETQGFFALKDSYSAIMTDQATHFTSVVKDGNRKTVRNYGNAGPTSLWGLEMAIRGVAADIKWVKDDDYKAKGP